MNNFKKVAVSIEQYEKIKAIQEKNGNDIQEHFIGSRRNLYVKNTLIASLSVDYSLFLGNITNSQFNSFLGRFNKHLYNQFLTKPELYNLNIDFKGVSRNKNIDLWDKLPINTYFYNLDLKSAYWQIAYRLGYISENIFNAYMSLDDYKQVKRLCISFLGRSNNMFYQVKNDKFLIECDTRVFKKVYNNIRNELYNCIKKVIVSPCNYLEYNIDGIYVIKEDVDLIRSEFKKMNLKYKITECRKINETDFLYGHKLRKFKNK
jgi:hypothetical protein